MINFFLRIIGVGLPAIIERIAKEKTKQANAKTEQEKIQSEERIKVLESKKEIILQSQKGKFEQWVRIAFAIPFIVYIWKLVLWDKVFGLGATDNLSQTLEYVMWTVLSGYFILTGIDRFRR